MKEDTRKTLFVGGSFDETNGKPSKIAKEVFKQVETKDSEYHNGGNFKELESLLDRIEHYKIIYWFPNIDNTKQKIVEEIKKRNDSSILITSKRNVEKDYKFEDILQHALKIKSNLILEFIQKDKRYFGRVEDSLGNEFLEYNDNFTLLGKVIKKSVDELDNFTRAHSESVGEKLETPDKMEFFEIVKEYAQTFHDLLYPASKSTERFLGNASFRCESGFPSFKHGNNIFVSRRNVDKRFISKDSFIAVKEILPVRYFGDLKPSVDTPIQLKLYEYYPKVNYAIHSHTYIKDAPFTSKIIPCGALEEADEIISLFPEREKGTIYANLKGHGSIALSSSLEKLKNIDYIPRPMPELHADYANEFL